MLWNLEIFTNNSYQKLEIMVIMHSFSIYFWYILYISGVSFKNILALVTDLRFN